MKATYDKNDFQSVLEAIRDELGKPIFRDAVRMYGAIYDLAPGFKPEGKVLYQLSELGMLSELEQAADSQNQLDIDRARMKIRYHLTQKMFISEEKAAFFVDALESLYGLKTPPPSPPHIPTPTPVFPPPYISTPPPIPPPSPPTPKQSKFPVIVVALTLIIAAIIGVVILNRNYIEWTLENGVLTISGRGPMQNYKRDYSSGSGYYTATPWWNKKYDIISIVIKSGVTSIDSKAFWYCSNLTTVVISDSVISIGDHAFAFCDNLTDVIIPNSITNIGTGAFEGCKSLTEVIISNGITNIRTGTFENCLNLTEVTIPDRVVYIERNAFGGCKNLASVSISPKTNIAYDAFPRWTTVIQRES